MCFFFLSWVTAGARVDVSEPPERRCRDPLLIISLLSHILLPGLLLCASSHQLHTAAAFTCGQQLKLVRC